MRRTLAGAPGLLYRRDSTPQTYPSPPALPHLLLMAAAEVSQCVCS